MSSTGMSPQIARAIEAFNDQDAEKVAAEFAEEGTFFDPPQDEELTRDEFREYCAELFEAFPDGRVEERRVIDSADGATVIEWTFHGTQKGQFEDVPPTGNAVALPGVSIVAVSDDGITSWRDYWDQQTLAEQLGLE